MTDAAFNPMAADTDDVASILGASGANGAAQGEDGWDPRFGDPHAPSGFEEPTLGGGHSYAPGAGGAGPATAVGSGKTAGQKGLVAKIRTNWFLIAVGAGAVVLFAYLMGPMLSKPKAQSAYNPPAYAPRPGGDNAGGPDSDIGAGAQPRTQQAGAFAGQGDGPQGQDGTAAGNPSQRGQRGVPGAMAGSTTPAAAMASQPVVQASPQSPQMAPQPAAQAATQTQAVGTAVAASASPENTTAVATSGEAPTDTENASGQTIAPGAVVSSAPGSLAGEADVRKQLADIQAQLAVLMHERNATGGTRTKPTAHVAHRSAPASTTAPAVGAADAATGASDPAEASNDDSSAGAHVPRGSRHAHLRRGLAQGKAQGKSGGADGVSGYSLREIAPGPDGDRATVLAPDGTPVSVHAGSKIGGTTVTSVDADKGVVHTPLGDIQ